MARSVVIAFLFCAFGDYPAADARRANLARTQQWSSDPEEDELLAQLEKEFDEQSRPPPSQPEIEETADSLTINVRPPPGGQRRPPPSPREVEETADSLTINVRPPPDGPKPEKTALKEDCPEHIEQKTMEAMERVMAFFGEDCGVSDEEHLEPKQGGGPGELEANEAGRGAICQKSCLENSVLRSAAPSFAELQEKCGGAKEMAMAAASFALHDAMTAAWQTCPPPPQEQDDSEVAGDSPREDSVVAEDFPHVQTPKKVKEPKCKGKRILQQRMALQLNSAIGEVTQPTCGTLIHVFTMFDYKHAGRLSLEEVDGMLDVLTDDQKAEVMEKFTAVAGDGESVTFRDFARVKLGHDEIVDCMLSYAKAAGQKKK